MQLAQLDIGLVVVYAGGAIDCIDRRVGLQLVRTHR